jgi:hypothetical protein
MNMFTQCVCMCACVCACACVCVRVHVCVCNLSNLIVIVFRTFSFARKVCRLVPGLASWLDAWEDGPSDFCTWARRLFDLRALLQFTVDYWPFPDCRTVAVLMVTTHIVPILTTLIPEYNQQPLVRSWDMLWLQLSYLSTPSRVDPGKRSPIEKTHLLASCT